MEIIVSSIELTSPEHKNALAALQSFPMIKSFPLDKLCFFDIETTGLAADISSLYLIGCCYIEGDKLHTKQWFADDYTSEKELLISFSEFIQDFDALLHYNGTGFDLPYMEKKYAFFHLPSPFATLLSFDFYKMMRPYKKWFPIENLKLTTIEKFLCISRSDRFSGKDCIELYSEFMQMKYFREDEKKNACQHALLLHNYDDIVGTFLCSQILLYLLPFTSEAVEFQITVAEQELFIEAVLPGLVPTAFRQQALEPYFAYKNNCFRTKLSIIEAELYYFFKDYKNYYYLLEEDQAIHKSVACFVEDKYREKANSKNCYTKKSGTFLPISKFKKTANELFGVPLFFTKKKEQAYIEWNPSEGNFHIVIAEYLKSLL